MFSPFIADAVNDVKNPVGLYVEDGGTINVPALIKAFVNLLYDCVICDLLEKTNVTSINYSLPEIIEITTSNGQRLLGRKVILTPGAYVNQALATLTPAFPSVINHTIYLWSSMYWPS